MDGVMNFKDISSKCQILFSIFYIVRILNYGVDILVLASSFNDYTLHFHGILIVLLKSVFLHAYLLHNWFYNGRFASFTSLNTSNTPILQMILHLF